MGDGPASLLTFRTSTIHKVDSILGIFPRLAYLAVQATLLGVILGYSRTSLDPLALAFLM